MENTMTVKHAAKPYGLSYIQQSTRQQIELLLAYYICSALQLLLSEHYVRGELYRHSFSSLGTCRRDTRKCSL